MNTRTGPFFAGTRGLLRTGWLRSGTTTSQDTAYRDILDLVAKGILTRGPEGGRSAGYALAPE